MSQGSALRARGLGRLVMALTHCLGLQTTVSCCQKFAAVSLIFLSPLPFFSPSDDEEEKKAATAALFCVSVRISEAAVGCQHRSGLRRRRSKGKLLSPQKLDTTPFLFFFLFFFFFLVKTFMLLSVFNQHVPSLAWRLPRPSYLIHWGGSTIS